MRTMKIYDVEYYRPFHFRIHLKESYLRAESKGAIIFASNGYFAILSEQLDQLSDKNRLTLLEIERLNQQGIVIGRLHRGWSSHQQQNQTFSRQLIYEEICCIQYFLRLITIHLESRESEGEKLTNHDNVRILIGKVVQSIEEIEASLESEILIKPLKQYIANVVRTACNHLAKLAGGRSFISSSVIEMLCTFEVLNKIYLH